MKKGTRVSIFLLLLLSINAVALRCYADSGINYQGMLLDFYSQQLLAHAVSLFAAITASFIFTTYFFDKSSRRGMWGKSVFLVFCGLLFAIVFYIGARMVFYGYLASATIFHGPSMNYTGNEYGLNDYRREVTQLVLDGGFNIAYYERNFMTHLSSLHLFPSPDHLETLFNGFSLSWFLGVFLAYLILISFSRKKIPHLVSPLFLFATAAVTALATALGINARQPLPTCKVVMLVSFLISLVLDFTAFVVFALERTTVPKDHNEEETRRVTELLEQARDLTTKVNKKVNF
jgi:hypothetical protein